LLRIASAIVLAPLAVGAAYAGGQWFIGFWLLAAAIVLWEWLAIVSRAPDLGPSSRAGWIILGICYAGALFVAPIVLRADAEFGFPAIIFLFAVVWVTDVFAYFAGRLIGGPKLWPAVSPKKTWSGAIAGLAGAIAAGVLVGVVAGVSHPLAIGFLSVVLSAAAQGGDLFESAFKRRFGTKDAGHLIPGHGGLMDRLDGFLTAALLAALLGGLRGGLDGAGRGILLW
jgi:phosphatidate cytidylyltransferase